MVYRGITKELCVSRTGLPNSSRSARRYENGSSGALVQDARNFPARNWVEGCIVPSPNGKYFSHELIYVVYRAIEIRKLIWGCNIVHDEIII